MGGQMTRLRQIVLAGLTAVAIGGVASSASAMEIGTFQNRLDGATIGLPSGARHRPASIPAWKRLTSGCCRRGTGATAQDTGATPRQGGLC